MSPTAHTSHLAELFRTLGNPLRLELLQQLQGGEATVSELTDQMSISQPLVSQHLRVLRMAKLVTATRRGREVIYSITDHHVSHIINDAAEHLTEGDTA